MSKTPQAIVDDIKNALQNDELVLPTLPEAAMQAREAANDPDISVAQLAKVVENYLTIGARLIKIANSPAYRTEKASEDVKSAISKLGIRGSANMIASLAIEQIFHATSEYVNQRMRDIWNQSTEVAGIAHVLSKHYTRLPPDQATLAGLIHEIGALPILTYAEAHEELLENTHLLEQLIKKAHTHLGARILKQWGFSKELLNVPKLYLNLERTHSGPPDFIDLVTVAHLQSAHEKPNHPLTNMDWSSVPAFEKLGLDTNIESTELEDLSEEMQAAIELLQ